MIKEATKETNTQFIEAVKRKDAAGMAAVYTDDARVLPPNSPMVSGRQAIKDFWQNFLNMGVSAATLATVSLEEKGDTAIEVGAYTLEIKPEGGQTMKDEGKYVVIWKRQADGSWKWDVDIFNSNLAAPT